MVTNLVLMKENDKVKELSKSLGFSKCFFLDKNFVLIEEENKKSLLKQINKAKEKGYLVLVKPKTEEQLRFVLERTHTDMVIGQESVCPKDSVHFLRGGLDQVTCKLARDKKKIICFSFKEILDSKNVGNLLARMKVNIRLCKKYNVKMFFSSFSINEKEMRSFNDLRNFWQVLGSNNKKDFEL